MKPFLCIIADEQTKAAINPLEIRIMYPGDDELTTEVWLINGVGEGPLIIRGVFKNNIIRWNDCLSPEAAELQLGILE